ncbi:PP2C family serine/threonine-protein phosphatase [Mucilaginibacter flavus]|uniref:PP2C family serine/threonine-protein phosphatase n=1 Tax=Mucilaginibacter flavus TaxID=931504 RepID=UPI0025B28B51|nr:PP2C family serine/threonine-protein phosphatase [Mucilaginibacter flavus]MDN3582527.1 PP2C family serine/threonine-protein phosphatase [Mucilaginibacter flavus]
MAFIINENGIEQKPGHTNKIATANRLGRSMIWKVIAQSVIGSSHVAGGRGCEDAVRYCQVPLPDGDEALIGFVSDGAGSAAHAAEASTLAVNQSVQIVHNWIIAGKEIDDIALMELAEQVYDKLDQVAQKKEAALNEFSCTLLGFVLLPQKACFMQIGDGAIARNDGSGYFTHLWWPHNGEYQNTTAFLIDDPSLKNLKTKVIDESIAEVALFTDGLQMLALNNETETVHQPFLNDLFKVLRMTENAAHIDILNNRLAGYLASDTINSRTDDDKTLLLATRLKNGKQVV